jgi:hypothetical protein
MFRLIRAGVAALVSFTSPFAGRSSPSSSESTRTKPHVVNTYTNHQQAFRGARPECNVGAGMSIEEPRGT